MNRLLSMTKTMIAAAALAAAASDLSHADDSSIGRFASDGYAYFNAPGVSGAPSAFRQSNPNGLSVGQYQTMSSEASAWHPAPAADTAPSRFRQTNPNGLSISQFQSMSSEAFAWHSQPASTQPTGGVNTAGK
jgi:hypothetical protein